MSQSYVEFIPPQPEADTPFQLSEESADSLKKRIDVQSNFGGLAVHGVGMFISDHMPSGISSEQLPAVAEELASQVGCSNVASSIIYNYEKRAEVTA